MTQSTVTGAIPPSTAATVLARAKEREAAGDRTGARQEMRALVATGPTPANVAAAARFWEARQDEAPLPGEPVLRIALVGTGTLGTLGAQIRVATAGAQIHPQRVFVGEFDQWAQELLDPASTVYAVAPDIIAVCVAAGALFPRTMNDPFVSEVELASERETGVTMLLRALEATAANAPSATVLLHTFAIPDHPPLGDILDAQDGGGGQRSRVAALNGAVAAGLARAGLSRVVLLDQERVEARFGKGRVRDARLWYMASVPFSDDFQRALAEEYVRLLRPLTGRGCKCIVLDLDNTLWGGVVGEDGIDGIKLGGTAAPGNAYRDFQIALDRIRQRGVLLALCSKNNEDDAMPVLQNHPEMVLRPEAFAAIRMNWDDKAANIASLASELNLGLDSFVFLDDNAAERSLVRQQLPQVLTPEMPRDPARYTSMLLSLDVFDAVALTDEDRRRSSLYAEQRQRREFAERVPAADGAGVTGHLHSLGMEVRLGPATAFTAPRVAQLLAKTNQFNVTTRRHSDARVRAMTDDTARWGVYTVVVRDRFGDSGLTGVVIIDKADEATWVVDSFLLSCRVMGRGVEQALLRYAALQARAGGAQALRGVFLPTPRNTPAADFFARMGFTPEPRTVVTDEDTTGEATAWLADITAADIPAPLASYPDWLSVESDDTSDVAAVPIGSGAARDSAQEARDGGK